MPAVTVCWNPKGLPIAMATWPTRTREESPRRIHDRSLACTFSTARSESGSSPTIFASAVRPSGSVTSSAAAPLATWLLVTR
jgi:hypothetical protein